MEIRFYHICLTDLYQPMLSLIVSLYRAREERMVVCLPNKTQGDMFSQLLWSYKNTAFIPHATFYQDEKDQQKNAFIQRQPILITDKLINFNQASVSIVAAGAEIEALNFNKLAYFFAAYEKEQCEAARKAWDFFQTKNYNLAYRKQDKHKKWDEIAPCF